MNSSSLKGAKKGGGKSGAATEDPNTLTTDTLGKGIYLFSEGPVEGLLTGDAKSIYFNDVPLLDSEGNANYQGVTWTFRNGLPDQDWIPGHSSASSGTPVGIKVTTATPVVQTLTGAFDAVNVTIGIPALTSLDTSSGALKGTNLSYAIEVKTAVGSWVTVHDVNLYNQKTTVEWQKTYRCDLPAGGSPWQVRVRRITPDSASVNINNDLYFQAYATVIDGKFNYRNSCVMGLQFNAKLFQNSIPNVKARIKGIKCWVPANYDPVAKTYATSGIGTTSGIWDGTFKAAWTNNPIWIYHDLLINNRYGLGQDFNPTDDPESAFVDKWSLYPIAQFCDQPVSNGYGGTEARYSVNIQIGDKTEAYDLLQQIMSTVNGMIYFSAEQVVAVADMPTTVDDIFTQADVVEGLFEYSGTALKTRHSAVLSYYNDPDNLFKRNQVVYEDYDQIGKLGYRPIDINTFGCTSRAQALRTAKWFLHTEKSQTQTVTFKTGHRGGFITPGQLLRIYDDFRSGDRRGGKIISRRMAGGNQYLTLDAPFTGTGASILYVAANGTLATVGLVGTYDDDIEVRTASAITPMEGASYGIQTPDLVGALYRVITVQEDESDQYTVIALEHDDTKYAIIDAPVLFGDEQTSVYGNGKLAPVTEASYEEWYEEVSGSEVYPRVTISWIRPNDKRISTFELELKSPTEDYKLVQDSEKLFWDSPRLQVDFDQGYSARIRSKDGIGRVSTWYYIQDFDVVGRDTAPPPVTNELATGIINGFIISWDNPQISDFKHVEVWEGVNTDLEDAVLVSQVKDDFYVRQGLLPYNKRYVWLRVVSHARINQFSTYVGPLEAEAKGVNIADFDDEVTGIPIVDVLPNPSGYVGPPIVFLTTDQKLWTYVGGAWELTVADIPDDFNPGIPGFTDAPDEADYEEGQTYFNTTDGKLYRLTSGVWVAITADSDAAIPVGAVLPTVGMAEGDLFFLTTDDKLYRYTGTLWTASIAATDVTGQITTTQIADDAITTGKILANAITSAKITAGAITTAKLDANAVTANELAANSVIAGKIAANAVETNTIAANAITTAKINAGAVTANELAANSVIAGKIAAGAVTANAIGAGTITVAINLGSSGKIFLDGVNNRIVISD